MKTIDPYFIFDGNCEEAFNFYKKVFGGKLNEVHRYKDMPPDEGQEVPKDFEEKIMNMSLSIGKDLVIMGSDAHPTAGKVSVGRNFFLSVNAESKKEADKIFGALSEGGHVKMPQDDTFWGSYFGMLVDKFGVQWMISYSYN